MKVKFNEQLVKKFSFSLDDNANCLVIAAGFDGKPLTQEEFAKTGGVLKPIHVTELNEEFIVTKNNKLLSEADFFQFKEFFEVL